MIVTHAFAGEKCVFDCCLRWYLPEISPTRRRQLQSRTHAQRQTRTPIHTVRKFHEMSQGGGKGRGKERVNNANLNKHRLPSAMWVCLICVSHVCVYNVRLCVCGRVVEFGNRREKFCQAPLRYLFIKGNHAH